MLRQQFIFRCLFYILSTLRKTLFKIFKKKHSTPKLFSFDFFVKCHIKLRAQL